MSKTVVISGASSGIGAEVARLYAKSDATVVLLARSGAALDQVRDDIAANGGRAHAYAVDLGDPHAVLDIAKRITADAGPVDTLINNAGAGRWLAAAATPIEEFRQLMVAPYLASAHLTRAFLPPMMAAADGRIAFVVSPASLLAWRNAAGYIAARHAVKGFAESVRAEVRPYGVSITLVFLGTVKSPYWRNNPGSRQNLPKGLPILMPELSVEEAAKTVFDAAEARRRRVYKPAIFRVIAALDALTPGSIVR